MKHNPLYMYRGIQKFEMKIIQNFALFLKSDAKSWLIYEMKV